MQIVFLDFFEYFINNIFNLTSESRFFAQSLLLYFQNVNSRLSEKHTYTKKTKQNYLKHAIYVIFDIDLFYQIFDNS